MDSGWIGHEFLIRRINAHQTNFVLLMLPCAYPCEPIG